MFNLTLEESPQLRTAVEAEDYVDSMSAPRVDPVHPEMTGWAMKSRREKRGRPSKNVAESPTNTTSETAS